MLPRTNRLRRNAEIRHVRRKGHRRSHPLLLLFAIENNRECSRFAISVSGRLGNAVVRNRVRRRIREAIRRRLVSVQPGWDILIVATTGSPSATFIELEEALADLLLRMGILPGQATN